MNVTEIVMGIEKEYGIPMIPIVVGIVVVIVFGVIVRFNASFQTWYCSSCWAEPCW